MKNDKKCLYCQKKIKGRIDKKFCDEQCKGTYHYEKKKEGEGTLYSKILLQLKTNRRVLSHFNPGGKATIRKDLLLQDGFDPNYFTHYWKNTKGQVYLFCFEQGFRLLTEHNKEKYVLIHWQPYMEN